MGLHGWQKTELLAMLSKSIAILVAILFTRNLSKAHETRESL